MNKSIKKIALIVVILTILNVILSVNVFASEGELTISGENYMEMKSDNGNYFASTIKSMQSDESVQLKVEYEQNGEKVDVTDLCTWESEDTSVATVEKGCITAVSQKFNYTHINVVYKGIERKILVTVGKDVVIDTITDPVIPEKDMEDEETENIVIIVIIGIAIGMAILGVILLIIKKIRR